MRPRHGPYAARGQRGTALLLAMVILTLVATLAAGMVWQQERAIRVEGAARARAQAQAVLAGALDWARLILRADARGGRIDHLGEPWAVPFAEARLSTFLAADPGAGNGFGSDEGPEAFLSGRIEDLQARFNVRSVLGADGAIQPDQVAALQRLCVMAGVPGATAEHLAAGLSAAASNDGVGAAAPLMPVRWNDLGWLGIDATTLASLAPYATLLPVATPVNLNTASREVIAAATGMDLGSAERLIQARQQEPLRALADVTRILGPLPASVDIGAQRVAVGSKYFEVTGRLRLEDRIVEQRAIVERRGASRAAEVAPIDRQYGAGLLEGA